MRSRAPTRLRQRTGVLKCPVCGRKCLSPQALKTHQETAHKNKTTKVIVKRKPTVVVKPKPSEPVPVALVKNLSRTLQSSVHVKKSPNRSDTATSSPNASNATKTSAKPINVAKTVPKPTLTHKTTPKPALTPKIAPIPTLTTKTTPKPAFVKIAPKPIVKTVAKPFVTSTPKPAILSKTETKPKPVPIVAKTPQKTPIKKKSIEKVLQEWESDSTNASTDYSTDSGNEVESVKPEKKGMRRVEFECPKCIRRFPVYFSAFRHIQKHHCVDNTGEKVSQDSPDLIKPIRIELCTQCSTRLTSDIHTCPGPIKFGSTFICTGCNEEYRSMQLFDQHKSGRHSDGVESMFFPTLDEFLEWKHKMEEQTKSSFHTLEQNDTKKVYRCDFRTTVGTTGKSKNRMCPASIVVQEYSKGFQVHFYQHHYDHGFEKYALSDLYRTYSITSIMHAKGLGVESDRKCGRLTNLLSEAKFAIIDVSKVQTNKEDESDLYVQFKNVMEAIIDDAAKVNVNQLKLLTQTALDMRVKIETFIALEDDISEASDYKEVPAATAPVKRSDRLKSRNESAELKRRSSTVFQSTENTLKAVKIEAPSPKISRTYSMRDVNSEAENLTNSKQEAAPKMAAVNPIPESPSFNDTFQDFLDKNFNKGDDRKTKAKKQIVKTKMGQFKPSPTKKPFSPKTERSGYLHSISRLNFIKEIKYEIKEQDNDCNILILKI